jgi:hypothetical protein
MKMKMKKINILLFTTILVVSFTECKNAKSETAKQDAVNVNIYVDSLEKITPVYTVGYWNTIDSMYQKRAMQAEMSLANLEATDKENLNLSKAKYSKLKADYETKLIAQENSSNLKLKETEIALVEEKNKDKSTSTTAILSNKSDYRQVLRNRLFGEGKIGTDMKFEFVNAKNILSIYKNFVNTVDDNKKKYTREDWDEIKVLYEALDNKKNSIEKNLATNDNLTIAGLKIKFAGIKATYRITAKADEKY